MGLTSVEFIFLVPFVVFLYYLAPKRVRHLFLLVINLLFCLTFGTKCVAVLVGQAMVAWIAALVIDCSAGKRKKVVVAVSVILVASVLLFYKFGVKSFPSLIAPIGISFYTMQAISYVVDVYKGVVAVAKDPIRVMVYMSFFPTITSGPIYRYKDFAACFEQNLISLKPDYYRITNGLIYVLYGYFLKLVVADRIAIPVNVVFENFLEEHYGGLIHLIIAIGYSVQIYTDFAGYSAIAIGIAQILGYSIPENFRAPYLSMSVKEFWGRWHVSLSTWLRDYIYIPLGGNRRGKIRKYANILVTFIISGLWHGVAWHFLFWGGLHAFYQIFGDLTKSFRQNNLALVGVVKDSAFHRTIKRVFTFGFVTVAWVFFRLEGTDALRYLYWILEYQSLGRMISGEFWNLGLSPFWWILLGISMLIIFIVDRFQYQGRRIDEVLQSQGALARGLFVIAFSLVILILGVYGDQHDASYFLYRDF